MERARFGRRAFGRYGMLSLGVIAAMPLLDGFSSSARELGGHAEWRLDSGWTVRGATGARTEVTLPDSVARQSWRNWDPTSWENRWHYRKTFDVPGFEKGGKDRYFLRFSGALSGIEPSVNGQALGEHRGGYLPAEYEITEHLGARNNWLDVLLDGSFEVNVPPNRPGEPSSSVDFWQLAGLHREVSLRAVPRAFLADVFARPRHVLDAGARRVDARVTVDSALADRDLRVLVELLDGDLVLGGDAVTAPGPGVTEVQASITGLEQVRLWQPHDPKRYSLRARLYVGGELLHEYAVPLGFREAEFTERGFFLNGQRRTIMGLNRHAIYPYLGFAMPPRVQRRDARILAELNCDMVRCSHYPQHEAFLDACDELGILVYEEAPGWGALGDQEWRDAVRRDVREMILRDRNHPSIVLWGTRLNETPNNRELYADTKRIAEELDGSRPTTGALIAADYDTEEFDQDVFSYNDYAASQVDGTRLPRLKRPRAGWPWLVTESVGTLSGPASFYRRTDPVTDQHGQALAHAMVHEQAAADERYCGALGWTGFDYASGNGNQFEGVKYPGVLDQFREPKLGAAVYAAQVSPQRRVVIEPAFYWDFTGKFSVRELGSDALIFANAEVLELLVDERPHSVLRPDRTRFPNLRYPPFRADFSALEGTPELRIDAYSGGVRIGTRRFSAEHSGDRLSVRVDDSAIAADGIDATRVVLRVVDRYGAPRPGRPGSVRFSQRGPGELIGDNPFPLGETGGVAAIWVRGERGRPGLLRLRAEHESLGAEEVTIRMGS